MTLTPEEYQARIRLIVAAARVLACIPIEAHLRAISDAHTVVPMLDPTLYRQKHQAMDADAEMFRAALPLAQLGRKLEAMTGEVTP